MKKALWTKLPNAKVSPKKPRNRLRMMSEKRSQQMVIYLKKRKLFLKEHPKCQRCKRKGSEHVHHSRGKTGSLLNVTRFWFALCFDCHRWVTDHTTLARKEGFICEKGKWNDNPDR